MSPKKPPAGEESFEQALGKLEQIVERLEQGDVPLEESLRLYEEGVALSRKCSEKLQQVELVLKRLERDVDGNLKLLDEHGDEA
jgi:exodeoxyribonuclease VII small subunit